MITHLDLGSFTPSVLLRVARLTGRLAEQDLVVEEHAVASSPEQFRSLLAGELDVVLTSPDNVLAYRYAPDNPLGLRANVKIVAAVDRGLGLGLFARPGTHGPDELRGGIFAVDVPRSGFAFAMYALAEFLGLRRSDYTVDPIGSTPIRLEALLAGRCDATMLNAGNELTAEAAGCVRLLNLAHVVPQYLGTVLAIEGETVAPAVGKLAVALRATAEELCAGGLDDLAADVASQALSLSVPLGRRFVHGLKDPIQGLVRDGIVDRTSLEAVIELHRRFSPAIVDGVDALAAALAPASGLLAPATQRSR